MSCLRTSLCVTELEQTDSYNVAGRGEMHLAILIETMRREGYEFQVSTPRVLYKDIDGKRCEPVERMVADVPEGCVGAVLEKMGARRGELISINSIGSRMRLELDPVARAVRLQERLPYGYARQRVMSSVLTGTSP